ncbi:hypothetical protein HYV84_05010 [Candidatus Woesearchaeota archaeon]|nr:hypothetical protein [Candidatus Woesearchaeota archaeon]
MKLAIPTAILAIAFIILPTAIAVDIRFAQGQDAIPNDVAKTTYPNLWQKVITRSGEPIPDRVNHFFSWQGGEDQCSYDKPCININGNGYCCNSVEKTELLPDYFLGIGNIYQKKPVSLCQVCNEKPSIVGSDMGALYTRENQNSYSLKKFIDPENEKQARIAGAQIKTFEEAQRASVIIGDKEKSANELTVYGGDKVPGATSAHYGAQMNYVPEPPVSFGNLPQRKNFFLKVEDGGGDNNAPKASEEREVSSLLCPDGKITLLKSGNINAKIDAFVLSGKIGMIIENADIGVDVGQGLCTPSLKLEVKFEGVEPVFFKKIKEDVESLAPFDVPITVIQSETREEVQVSLSKFILEMINENKLDGGVFGITLTIALKVVREGDSLFVTILAKELSGDKRILKNERYGILPDQIPLLVEEFIKKFRTAKDNFKKADEKLQEKDKKFTKDTRLDLNNVPAFSNYQEAIAGKAMVIKDNTFSKDILWYFTPPAVGNANILNGPNEMGTFTLNQKVAPNEKLTQPPPLVVERKQVRFAERDGSQIVWNVFGELAMEEKEAEGKRFYFYHEYPPLYKAHYEPLLIKSPLENSIELKIEDRTVEGYAHLERWSDTAGPDFKASVHATWSLEAGFDISKARDFKDTIRCCPNFEEVKKRVDEFKKAGRVTGNKNSVFFVHEGDEPVTFQGIAYQFFPPIQFAKDVEKNFGIALFRFPQYIRQEDSFLSGCDFEVLDEVTKEIGPSGGKLILPDDNRGLDKVEQVDQVFPPGAVLAPNALGIRRLRIISCGCNNLAQDPGEQGIDCGGICKPCGADCSDGVQNQDETGIDMGGVCIRRSITNDEEPCEWDTNRDGITKPCVSCSSDQDCAGLSCDYYASSCAFGSCECSPKKPNAKGMFNLFERYLGGDQGAFQMRVIGGISGWLSIS